MSEYAHEIDVDDEEPVDELAEPELDDVDEEPVEASPAPAGPPRFSYNHRLWALGFSRSGKSEILNLLFSGLDCQKVLIDNKPEFAIDDVEPVHDPSSIDWREPIIHYQPAPGSDCSQYEELFGMAFVRRGLTICVHEFGALVDYNANRAGRYLISYVSQGGALGLGLLAGTQRPVYAPVSGMTEANHVLVFTPQLARRDDNVAASEALSPVDGAPFSTNDMIRELALVKQEHGPYSFLWKDRLGDTLQAFPPIPEQLRSLSIVRRVEDA